MGSDFFDDRGTPVLKWARRQVHRILDLSTAGLRVTMIINSNNGLELKTKN